jgi:hypothetical protein
MKFRVAGISAVLLTIAIASVGCSAKPEKQLVEVSARPVPTASAVPTATPVNDDPEELSCQTLTPEVALAEFEANGFVLDEEYEAAVRKEGAVTERFFDLGGLACKWFLPNSGAVATFGYSEIGQPEAIEVQVELTTAGYVRSEEGTGVLFTLDPAASPEGLGDMYLFEPGAWYQAVKGVTDVRDNIHERELTAAR